MIRATWGPKPFATEEVKEVLDKVDAFFRASSFGRVSLTFNRLSFSNRGAAVLPLVNPNGKTTVCHVAGYQQADLLGGDEVYQFKGTYSASIRIKKVPSGARKAEVRKLGKLRGQAPQWLPGIYVVDDPGVIADVGPLSPDVPRTGCGRG